MPADDGGFARALQIGSLAGIAFLVNKYEKGIFKFAYKDTNAPVKTIYLLYLFATLSAVWSIMPLFSAYLALQNIVLLCALVWLFTRFGSFVEIEKAFLYFSLLVIVFDAVCRRVFAEPGALFTHHLTNGSSAAMMISYCVAELLGMKNQDEARKQLLKGVLILSLVVIVLSTSSGANASAVFGVGVGILLAGKIFWSSLLFAGAFYLYIHQDLIDQLIFFIMPGKTKTTIETATGRNKLWDIIFELTAKKPWFGWGYACAERAATRTGRIVSPDAHNNYIGFYGGLGYVGSAIAYVSFAATLFYSWTRRLKPGYKGIIAGFSCALLNGYSFGFLAGKACNITVICFALIALTYSYSYVKYDDDTDDERED